jgi:hypothetical protein
MLNPASRLTWVIIDVTPAVFTLLRAACNPDVGCGTVFASTP